EDQYEKKLFRPQFRFVLFCFSAQSTQKTRPGGDLSIFYHILCQMNSKRFMTMQGPAALRRAEFPTELVNKP
ncbi:MAG: hypothetical protein ACI4NU_08265, partial [Christensenellales bacterium]